MKKEFFQAAIAAIEDKKGLDIKILHTEQVTSLCSYFIICSGTSSTHLKTLADECEYKLSEQGFNVDHREGRHDGGWILLDYGEVIIHIYNKQSRAFYDLERLWKDANEIDIKELVGE